MREAWPIAARTISSQRELAHNQESTLDILDRSVHLARIIAKDPQLENFVEHLICNEWIILPFCADQNQQSTVDLPDDLLINLDTRTGHTLDK